MVDCDNTAWSVTRNTSSLPYVREVTDVVR